jgi:glycosyltransferase involved in cell wall biosynthesis
MPEGVVASYVGRLGVHRGLETVLEALAHRDDTTDTPMQLVIVGPDDNDNADALRAHARTLGVSDQLCFVGWVDFEDVPRYMAASDICLVPHAATPHTETTIPHKLFQYMAAARPVLVTDVPPLKRIIDETNAGLVTPAGDPAAMADALHELGADSEHADTLGRNGRQAVEEHYRWEHDAETLRAIYRDLEQGATRN